MNIKIDQTRAEKQTIFKVSLELLKEGRFHAAQLSEIAFRAKMSDALMERIFLTREKLLQELTAVVIERIRSEVDEAGKYESDLKERFINAWMALYQFYTRHPEVIAFVDQFETLKQILEPEHFIHPASLKTLVDLFADERLHDDTPRETLAWLFHENALSAAKINARAAKPSQPRKLAEMFWRGLNG